jgi:hypothetical protein
MPWRRMVEFRYGSIILDLGTRWRWVVSFTPLTLFPGSLCIGGWMGPSDGLEAVEKRRILHCLELNPGLPACSPSLYWPSYPDPCTCYGFVFGVWLVDHLRWYLYGEFVMNFGDKTRIYKYAFFSLSSHLDQPLYRHTMQFAWCPPILLIFR